MGYLKAMKMLDIMYGRKEDGDLIINDYSNSDQVDDNVTRKSTSRFIFMLNGGPVS